VYWIDWGSIMVAVRAFGYITIFVSIVCLFAMGVRAEERTVRWHDRDGGCIMTRYFIQPWPAGATSVPYLFDSIIVRENDRYEGTFEATGDHYIWLTCHRDGMGSPPSNWGLFKDGEFELLSAPEPGAWALIVGAAFLVALPRSRR
jgi:hypothetical protein